MVNILCIGDSITWGYYLYGSKKYPYSDILEKCLKEYYKFSNIKIKECGINGERVVNQMEERLENILKEDMYDYVILLGGLNDLADIMINRKKTEDVINSFVNMYKVLNDNIYVKRFFHVTIPYCSVDKYLEYQKVKKEINDKILFELYSNKRYIIDIGNHEKYRFNYLYLDDKKRDEYWDDGLHFTPKGYELLAQCIFIDFKENISQLD
jgi:lysophospholipase L1-like esterase